MAEPMPETYYLVRFRILGFRFDIGPYTSLVRAEQRAQKYGGIVVWVQECEE